MHLALANIVYLYYIYRTGEYVEFPRPIPFTAVYQGATIMGQAASLYFDNRIAKDRRRKKLERDYYKQVVKRVRHSKKGGHYNHFSTHDENDAEPLGM